MQAKAGSEGFAPTEPQIRELSKFHELFRKIRAIRGVWWRCWTNLVHSTVATAGGRYFGFVTGGLACVAGGKLVGQRLGPECGFTCDVAVEWNLRTLRWLDLRGTAAAGGLRRRTGYRATMANFTALPERGTDY